MSQYRRNADSKLALASAAATTNADRQGYPLLASDFANMGKQGRPVPRDAKESAVHRHIHARPGSA